MIFLKFFIGTIPAKLPEISLKLKTLDRLESLILNNREIILSLIKTYKLYPNHGLKSIIIDVDG